MSNTRAVEALESADETVNDNQSKFATVNVGKSGIERTIFHILPKNIRYCETAEKHRCFTARMLIFNSENGMADCIHRAQMDGGCDSCIHSERETMVEVMISAFTLSERPPIIISQPASYPSEDTAAVAPMSKLVRPIGALRPAL